MAIIKSSNPSAYFQAHQHSVGSAFYGTISSGQIGGTVGYGTIPSGQSSVKTIELKSTTSVIFYGALASIIEDLRPITVGASGYPRCKLNVEIGWDLVPSTKITHGTTQHGDVLVVYINYGGDETLSVRVIDRTLAADESTNYQLSDPEVVSKITTKVKDAIDSGLKRMDLVTTFQNRLNEKSTLVGVQEFRTGSVLSYSNGMDKDISKANLNIGDISFTGKYPSIWVRMWQRFLLGWRWTSPNTPKIAPKLPQ